MRLVRPEVHTAIYLSGLMLFAAAIPLSNFCMSIAQWILVVNFFVDHRLLEKLKRLWTNKAALLIIGIWVLHVVGMLWSQDLDYAWKDVRVKLPLLIIPFILAGEKPISTKHLKWILGIHALAVVAGSLVILWGLFIKNIDDPRDAAFFVSHIRFALNVCVAAFTTGWYATRKVGIPLWQRIIYIFLGLWMLAFLFLLQSFTGLAVFAMTALLVLLRFSLHGKSKKVKALTLTVLALFILAGATWLFLFYQKNLKSEPVNPKLLEYYTPQGNPYVHNLANPQKENGYYLWLYVCYEELQVSWNKRSSITWGTMDHSGQLVNYTLIRFMTSKGLRKDQKGVESLSEDEIRAIENGVANVKDLKKIGFMRRIENVIWELDDYHHNGDPTNHSLMQRVELWRTSLNIIGQHPWAGIGTGDVPDMFTQTLLDNGSPLQGRGMRTHNQYLAIAVAMGIPALMFFLFALFYGPLKQNRFNDYFFFSFFVIAMLSMLTEDTLESQPGVSFVIFFYGLFLFARAPEVDTSIDTD